MTVIWAERALLPDGWAENVRVTVEQDRIAAVEKDAAPQGHRTGLLLPALANLHSHAFLCLDLLLVLLVRALAQWLAPGGGALATSFAWVEGLLLAWMPVYLLLMQKRVYAQGWPMTVWKYFVLGTCYSVLLSFAVVASMAIGLVAM